MGYIEVRTYKCDNCPATETRTRTNGLNYNWEGWVTVSVNATTYHEPYRHDKTELQGLYCPKCADTLGHCTLISKTGLNGKEQS